MPELTDQRQGDRGARGHQPHRGGAARRRRGAALLLPSRASPSPGSAGCAWWTSRRCRGPRSRCNTLAADGMVVAHRDGAGQGHAALDHGVPPDQPSAGLPGVRPGRRVLAADLLHEARPVRPAHGRREGAQAEGGADRAPRDARRRALHPLLALRALLRRDHRDRRARHLPPRRPLGDRAVPGPRPREQVLGQRDRHLPGGRAHRPRLPLPGAGLVPRRAKSICNGCARGCNIEVHTSQRRTAPQPGPADRPAQAAARTPRSTAGGSATRAATASAGSTTTRASPRRRRREGGGAGRDRVGRRPRAAWPRRSGGYRPEEIGVIASPQMSNEDLCALRRLLDHLRRIHRATSACRRGSPGDEDNLLIRADKNPNTRGRRARRPRARRGRARHARHPRSAAAGRRIKLLWVLHHDLARLGPAPRPTSPLRSPARRWWSFRAHRGQDERRPRTWCCRARPTSSATAPSRTSRAACSASATAVPPARRGAARLGRSSAAVGGPVGAGRSRRPGERAERVFTRARGGGAGLRGHDVPELGDAGARCRPDGRGMSAVVAVALALQALPGRCSSCSWCSTSAGSSPGSSASSRRSCRTGSAPTARRSSASASSGLLHPLADAIKMLTKEDFMPARADRLAVPARRRSCRCSSPSSPSPRSRSATGCIIGGREIELQAVTLNVGHPLRARHARRWACTGS